MQKLQLWAIICAGCLSISCASIRGQQGGEVSSPVPVVDSKTLNGVDKGCAYSYFLRGKSAEMEGELDSALQKFEQALACDESADYIRSHMALLLSKTGRAQAAIELMEEVVAGNPDDLESKSLLAGLYAQAGEVDKAIMIYRAILEKDPGNVNFMLMLGSLYARADKLDKAGEVFEAIAAKDPQSYVGQFYLARIYRELGRFKQAAAAYEKALSLNWSVLVAFELATFYEEQNQPQKAISLYRRLLEEDETNEQARRRIAKLYLDLGKADLAIKELRQLRIYVNDKRKVDIIIGRIMIQNKRHKEAISFLGKRLKEDPDFDAARYMLAVVYHEVGNKKKSKQTLQAIPLTSERYEDAVLFLGAIYRDEKNYSALEKLLQDNIANQKSRKPGFYIALAALYEDQKKLGKAKEIYVEAIGNYPNDPKMLFEYGLFLDSAGDLDEALKIMQKVLEVDPEDPYALNYVGYTWADKGINLETALKYIERAIVLKPDDAFIMDSLGWVYFKMGDYDRAVKELERATSKKTGDPTIHEHLGDAYMKIGKKEKAVKEYQKALQLHKDEKKKAAVNQKLKKLVK